MGKLLVLCGPTATGKTTLAARLSKKYNGELISADSQQVYKGRDLETNKERPDVPVWLYDVTDRGDQFSVSRWVTLAKSAISDIHNRNKLPIIVGGTGLYIKALLNPFSTIDIPPDTRLRGKNLSVSDLQKMVHRGDMNESDWNNPRRLIRKIEIAKSKITRKKVKSYNVLLIGLTAPLPFLYKRIDSHLLERIHAGMRETPANEHAIARKQRTWFKKQPDIHWIDISKVGYWEKIESLVSAWYTGGER